MKFMRECFLLFEGSFGFICSPKVLPVGSKRLDLHIPGISWVNLFGPDYVEMIGRNRFRNLPNEECETLEDGSIWLKLTDDWRDRETWDGWKKSVSVKWKLGMRWFVSPLIKNRWYPRLRNLRILDDSEEVERDRVHKSVREEFGYPPKMRDFLVVSQDDDGSYGLWVQEWTEGYLGTERFRKLANRFSEIEGVDRVEHMDREIVLIDAPGLEFEQFKKLIWDKFLKVAEEAFQVPEEDRSPTKAR